MTLDQPLCLSEPRFPDLPLSPGDLRLRTRGALQKRQTVLTPHRPPSSPRAFQGAGHPPGRRGTASPGALPRCPRTGRLPALTSYLAVAVLGQVFHQDFSAVAQLPVHPLQPRGDLLGVQRAGRGAPGVLACAGGGGRPARPRPWPRRAAQARAPLAATASRRRHFPGRPAAAGSSGGSRGSGERKREEARAGARRAEAAEWARPWRGGRRRRSQQPAGGRGNLSAEEEPENHLAGTSPSGPGPRARAAPIPPARPAGGGSGTATRTPVRRRTADSPARRALDERPGLGSGDAAPWRQLPRGDSNPRLLSPRGLPT